MWTQVARKTSPRASLAVLQRTLLRCSSTSLTNTPRTSSSSWTPQTAALVSVSLAMGYLVGRLSAPSSPEEEKRHLPSGLPRTCCETHDTFTDAQRQLPDQLKQIVGHNNVLPGTTRTYLKGARLGGQDYKNEALCVVTPTELTQLVPCVQAIVDADCVVLPQGRNTGLTGGSVPRSHGETTQQQRPVVIINMTKHLDTIFPIDQGDRVVCLAGAGLASLHRFLEEHFPDRESHSILGSTFLNPTTAAGVAFGSGGTQCRKGPSYTDRALYLKVSKNKWGENVVSVVNTLGVEGLQDEDYPTPYNERKSKNTTALEQLEVFQHDVKEGYDRPTPRSSARGKRVAASDATYGEHLCKHDATISRYNADTRGCDCNRSEGKVLILATVHDTFPKPRTTKTFWLSFDSLETALEFRKQVCLDNANDLPVSLEYMDRDAFDVIDRSGRVMGNLICWVGTYSPMIQHLWNVKLWIESLPIQGADLVCDKFLHAVNNLMVPTLPRRIMDQGKAMDHHCAMTVGEYGDGTNMERLLDRLQAFASQHGRDKILIQECRNESEAASLSAFRFVAAPAFRTWCVGEGLQGVSVDYALPKNGTSAPHLATAPHLPVKRMRYSHFGCNVVHEDLAYARDAKVHEAKKHFKATVEQECCGKLPAEHGHGIEYTAPPETQERWKRMDPLNVMNPGIGGLSENYEYKE